MGDPLKDGIHDYYEELSRSMDRKYSNDQIMFLRSTELSVLEDRLRPASDILDLGCGSGDSSIPLLEKGHRVTMLDISGTMLGLAKAKVDSLGLGEKASYVRGDIEEGCFGIGPFDMAYSSFGALNHVASLEAALRNIASLLRPRGRLVFSVANQFGIHRMHAAISHGRDGSDTLSLKRCQKMKVREASCRLWIRYYSSKELKRALKRTGFEVEDVCGAFFFLSPRYHGAEAPCDEDARENEVRLRCQWPANEFSDYLVFSCKRSPG